MSHRLHTTAPRLTAAATWQPESGTPATNTAPANGFPPPCPKTGTRHTTSFVFDSYIPLFWVNQQRILPAPHPLLIEEPACISIRPCKPVRPPLLPYTYSPSNKYAGFRASASALFFFTVCAYPICYSQYYIRDSRTGTLREPFRRKFLPCLSSLWCKSPS